MDIENPQNPTDGDKKNLREGLLPPNLEEVRQGGMYWKRPAFGVYHKGQKRDIAYFQLDESEGDCLLRLGACLKASTLMVTWNNGGYTVYFCSRWDALECLCSVLLGCLFSMLIVSPCPIIAALRQSTLRRCRKRPGTPRMWFLMTQVSFQWRILWGKLPHSLWAGCPASQKTFWLAHAYRVWCYIF